MRLLIIVLLIAAIPITASAELTRWARHSPQAVQQALAKMGYNPGPIDGQWGKRSIAALKAFQKAKGIPVSGVVDDEAADALFPDEKPTPPAIVTKKENAARTEEQTTQPGSDNSVPVINTKPVQVIVEKPATEVIPKAATNLPIKSEPSNADHERELTTDPAAKTEMPLTSQSSSDDAAPKTAASPESNGKTSQAVRTETDLHGDLSAVPMSTIAAYGGSALLLLFSLVYWRRRRSRRSNLASISKEVGYQIPPSHAPAPTVERRLAGDPPSQPQVSAPSEGKDIGQVVVEEAAEVASLETADRDISSAESERPDGEVIDFRVTLAAHNKEVAEFVARNIAAQDSVVSQPSGFEPVSKSGREDAPWHEEIASSKSPVGAARSSPDDFRVSLAAHNKEVTDFVARNVTAQASAVSPPGGLEPVPKSGGDDAPRPKEVVSSKPPVEAAEAVSDFRVSLAAHSRTVADFVTTNRIPQTDTPDANPARRIEQEIPIASTAPLAAPDVLQHPKPFFGTARRPDGSGPISMMPSRSSAPLAGDNGMWITRGMTISVGGISFSGGLVYFGQYLPRQGSTRENENCLINPKLAVSRTGDTSGYTMGYWPSYSQISGEARRSYLEWLSGPRNHPEAYIGYVFLYFYGLERRLLVDGDIDDSEEVVAEVRRLLDVYGSNGSFNRYARELLSAYELKSKPSSDDFIPSIEGNGFEVPMSIKYALGVRVRDGRAFEPDLLMKFALSHPETRVRTPARRAPELLAALFAEEMRALHPDGWVMKAGRFKKLKATYRACSGSFTIDVAAMDGTVPDISERAEPIGTARMIFESCSDKLDEYSRALGRSPGLKPTLSIAAKLPLSVRAQVASGLPGGPLARLSELADRGGSIVLGELFELASVDTGNSLGKAKLRELSQVLSSFGYGCTADPGYALRSAGKDGPVVVFKLSAADPQSGEASQDYRAMQLSTMLGMMIGHADGHFDDSEREALARQISAASGIGDDERTRLRAEMALAELDSTGLDEWTKRLKDVPPSGREALAAELVIIAAADGTVHAAEIKKLELLFKRMGLDQQSLYTLLHTSPKGRRSDDDIEFVIPPSDAPEGIPIPRPPVAAGSRIDFDRLRAIRTETSATTSILADIFADDEPTPEIMVPEPPTIEVEDGGIFDGLERRYGFLVTELVSQPTWEAADFENLVRNAGLMPGAARQAINDWSLEKFDELFIEDEDPVTVNAYLLPSVISFSSNAERLST